MREVVGSMITPHIKNLTIDKAHLPFLLDVQVEQSSWCDTIIQANR